ncbi:DUF1206 domain-containing protein [Leifsonia shinshuensis]|uniref:DUF1206 domain-containing protein n=1 Tax=Leifsonia shinshuensis TaxID=150026 RepID=UPI002862D93A|nr:DUF1206 domain-containing protein [Leifsonia shinshuensis]MDR6969933.1 uncharacterized membrane protein YidH (DUF202 family) [Leifsonia shinshuensis]
MTTPSRAASRVERQPAVRVLARVGLAAIGVLHILIGIIALAVATGAGGNADQTGALQALVAVPGGLFVLWAVIVGLIFLSLWQILQAITARRPGQKVTEVAKCVVYAALAGIAISIAAGGRSNASSSEQSMSAKLLAMPGGVFLLAAIGLAVVAVGVVFIVNGVTHRFERDLRLPPNRWATITTTLGRVGYVAKGIALIIVGGLVVFGALTSDPEKAGGLDGSLKALVEVPFGVILLILIALGLIAYGAFWCVRAFASRLRDP